MIWLPQIGEPDGAPVAADPAEPAGADAAVSAKITFKCILKKERTIYRIEGAWQVQLAARGGPCGRPPGHRLAPGPPFAEGLEADLTTVEGLISAQICMFFNNVFQGVFLRICQII
jgi:hypothetical protein